MEWSEFRGHRWMDLYQLEVISLMLEDMGVLWEDEPKVIDDREYRSWTLRRPDGTKESYDSRQQATDQWMALYERQYFVAQADAYMGPDTPRASWSHLIDALNDARRGLAELDLSGMLTSYDRNSEVGRAISALGSISRAFARGLQESHSSPLRDEEIGSRPELEKDLIDASDRLRRFVENTLVPWNVGHRRNPRYLRELIRLTRYVEDILMLAAHLPQFMPPDPGEN